MNSSYVVVSPVRNEAGFIETTIASMCSQTVSPAQWVIIDDGSVDNTRAIAQSHAARHPWIVVAARHDRGFDHVGQGIAEAVGEGIRRLTTDNWQYVVKLDGDLSFEENYFETLLEGFATDKRLGIAGGTPYAHVGDRLTYEEKKPEYFPPGLARMYDRRCFEEIGGIAPTLGWDTIDILRAQMHGWHTKRNPNLPIAHLRPVSSRNGVWDGKLRTGRNFYITGYHPLYLLVRCAYRLFQRPYILDSLGVLCGYVAAKARRDPLVVSSEERAFLRKQQVSRMLRRDGSSWHD